jgi:RNA polymerase-associated protein CTR9
MSGHDGQNIYISVMESSEVVRCSIDDLPGETEDLLEVLAAEAAPLSTWFDFARAYLAQGNIEAFKQICEEGVRPEVLIEVC